MTLALASCGGVTPDANIDLTAQTDKKTFVWFVATWCPHCNSEVPVLNEFYNDYKDYVNMQLIVTDKKYFRGNFSIPQDIKSTLTYQQATWDACDYVPSYVIYDENKNIVDKQCGAKLTYDELKEKMLGADFEIGNTQDSELSEISELQWSTLWEWDTAAVIETSAWNITLKLFPNEAPKTVLNFMIHAQNGYYNNLIFHRVIPNFMIQWGDPQGTWMGWESIYWNTFEDEFHPDLRNVRWSLSMANAGPATNGSQFFINQVNNSHLNDKHSVFGQVVEWLDILDAIAWVETGENNKPIEDIKIEKIEIFTFTNGTLEKKALLNKDEEIQRIETAKQEAMKVKQEADKNREVKDGDIVIIDYVGTRVSDNSVFYSTKEEWQPVTFEVGNVEEMLSGINTWVIWMKIWEQKELSLSAKDAFGEYDETKLQEVPKEALIEFEQNGFPLEVGTQLPTMQWLFTIKQVNDTTITLDLNHFLAGEDVKINIEIIGFVN